ncbi:MAG: hypothetical protein KBC81_02605 [Candidatus Pacebacteria bacterium]|nr:hypothetical protein [Candidatus Paceibacterota bacterium]
MTAVSPSVRPVKSVFDWSVVKNPVAISNIALMCLVVLGFAYYITGANAVASGQYKIASQRSQIAKLTESQSSLATEKSATENPVTALIFAKNQNMSEAKDIVYVFENSNVALQK